MRTLTLLLMVAGALGAADEPLFSVALFTGSGQGSQIRVTESKTCYGLSGDVQGLIPGTSIEGRGALSWFAMPGKAKSDGTRISLRNVQLAGDVLIPAFHPSIRFATGLSVQRWNVDFEGAPQGYELGKGPKLGFRAGYVWRPTRQWSAEALFQVAELGVSPKFKAGSYTNTRGWNPSWVQVGVHYHF